MFQSKKPALIIIDVQNAIDHFGLLQRSHPDAEQALARLLTHWRQHSWPIIHVRHSSTSVDSPYHANSPWFDFKAEVAPAQGEPVITKQENCAFIGTELEALLRNEQVSELVVGGVLLNHSVDATVRVATALGFRVMLVEEACPASSLTLDKQEVISAEQVHRIMLANLADEYARIVTLAAVIDELSHINKNAH